LYSFSTKERWALAGIAVMLIPALLINLGIVPLYVEEPRRATVALEMLLRNNWLAPTINGDYYYLKPPFFNWILASAYYLTGNQSEFITRMPTVISLALFGLLIFWSGKKYVSTSFGALSSLLFVTASGNLFFNSLLAEIDMFYSLVTYLSMISLFHLHQQKKYLLLFLSVYLLGAVGILTKGFPSLVFTGLSLLVFFIVKKDIRKLFSWQHVAGISLFLLITSGYFLAYSIDGDEIKYLLSLSVESGKRISGDTFWDYLGHMIFYPFDTLANLLPASILIIFILRKSFLKDIRRNSFLKFALLMLAVHFPVYWLPPGGKQRYIIMLYPFIIQIFTYFFLLYYEKEKNKFRFFPLLITGVIVIGTLACLVPLVSGKMSFIMALWPVCIGAFLLMGGVLVFHIKKPEFSMISLLISVIILKIVFGFTVLPVRAIEGRAPENKDAALKIAEIVGNSKVCILPTTYLPMQTTYYFEKQQQRILPLCPCPEAGDFLILEKIFLQDYLFRKEIEESMSNPLSTVSTPFSGDNQIRFSGHDFKTKLEFTLQKRNYLLIQLNH